MGFEKGHKLAKGGARPGAGRKKEPSTQMKEALEGLRGDSVSIIEALKKAGFGGEVKCPDCGRQVAYINPNVEACKYLGDRIWGKPTQKTVGLAVDLNISALEIADIMQRARHEFLRQTSPEQIEEATTYCPNCYEADGEHDENCPNFVKPELLPVGETEPANENEPNTE